MKLTTELFFFLSIVSLAAHEHMVTIQNDELFVTLAVNGAELQSFKHLETDIEYLWQGEPEYWERRSPNMFPVNVRFKDDRFSYKGVDYEMPRMGLAIDGAFEIQKQTGEKKNDAKLVLSLKSSKETFKHYPFPFELRVIFQLKGLKLHQKYLVTNTGKETMPFALGGHPGFRAPFIKRRDRSDYQYTFSEKLHVRRNVISDSLIKNEQVDFLQREDRLSLSDDRIPNGGMLIIDPEARVFGLALKKRKPYVTLNLCDFPNVNLWSPPGRPYVAIEPMVAHHDLADSPLAIEEKDYLIRLDPGKTRTYTYTITIDPKEGKRALGN